MSLIISLLMIGVFVFAIAYGILKYAERYDDEIT